MAGTPEDMLSRRERQIMDVIYARGRATAQQIRQALPDSLSDSAVRTFLRILEDKGHLRHTTEGVRYVYRPTRSRRTAARSAIQRLVCTFFNGSAEKALAALLDASEGTLSDDELGRLAKRINQARKAGR